VETLRIVPVENGMPTAASRCSAAMSNNSITTQMAHGGCLPPQT
jgi:hypothetical protein